MGLSGSSVYASEPTLAPPSTWTGWYIGAGGGFGMANHEVDVSPGPAIPPVLGFGVNIDGIGGEGGVFGITVGGDYQVSQRVVIGAFFNYDWSNIQSDASAFVTTPTGSGTALTELEVEDMWSLGARIGYLPSEDTLWYVTAGYTEVKTSDVTFSGSITGLGSTSGVLASVPDFSGYFIGGGVETRLTKSISLKLEYRYTQLSSETVTLLPGLAPEVNDYVTTEMEPTIQTGRISINYRF